VGRASAQCRLKFVVSKISIPEGFKYIIANLVETSQIRRSKQSIFFIFFHPLACVRCAHTSRRVALALSEAINRQYYKDVSQKSREAEITNMKSSLPGVPEIQGDYKRARTAFEPELELYYNHYLSTSKPRAISKSISTLSTFTPRAISKSLVFGFWIIDSEWLHGKGLRQIKSETKQKGMFARQKTTSQLPKVARKAF